MFAIAFDMVVADIREHYPKGISSAYTEIAKTLAPFGFERIQGSVYVTQDADMTNLIRAVDALRSMNWFRICARDIRGFRVENWSNFTELIRNKPTASR
jgi:virulence-associated protein VapD